MALPFYISKNGWLQENKERNNERKNCNGTNPG